MKKATRLLALLMTLALVVGCFAACGDKNETPDVSENTTAADVVDSEHDPAICGSWSIMQDVPATDVNAQLEVSLDLNADGTIHMYVTDEAVRVTAQKAVDELLNGSTQEQIDAVLKEMECDSVEDLVNTLFTDLKEELASSPLDGLWRSRDGQIIVYLTQEDYDKDQFADANVDTYSLSEDGNFLTVSGDIFTRK